MRSFELKICIVVRFIIFFLIFFLTGEIVFGSIVLTKLRGNENVVPYSVFGSDYKFAPPNCCVIRGLKNQYKGCSA